MQWEQLVAHQIDRWFVHGKGLVIQMIPQYLNGCRYHTIYYIFWFGHLPLSVLWHTSNVVLDVVSDVVNFSFFFPGKF